LYFLKVCIHFVNLSLWNPWQTTCLALLLLQQNPLDILNKIQKLLLAPSLASTMLINAIKLLPPSTPHPRKKEIGWQSSGPVVRAWDQEVCFLCGLRFEPCGCLYDGHWRLTWSLTSGPVGLVEVRASWPGHPR
jgi:hypothetical protein